MIWRRLVIALAVVLAAPYVLAVFYAFIEPPSTLMLTRRLQGLAVERRYVPLEAVAPVVVSAVILSEDAGFCRHYGIDPGAIRDAVRRAKAREDEVRGTSTITQQTAKNLFLWQGRSWLRKIIEAPLALWLDLIWSKKRMIEVYLNIVEWGDGVFGIEAAARRAFGVSASKLTAPQAALLATALPSPRKRDARQPGALHRRLAERLVVRLQRGGDMRCVAAAK